MDKLTVTIKDAAQILGIGRNLCYEAARRGEIPTIRIGGRILVPVRALEQMLTDGAPTLLRGKNGGVTTEKSG